MSTNTHFKINTPKIVHETIDGETVILNLDNGNYYSLAGIGADIVVVALVFDIFDRLPEFFELVPKPAG